MDIQFKIVDLYINDKKINEHMFINELVDYIYMPREEVLDNLSNWIEDYKTSGTTIGLEEMERDYQKLTSIDDKYIFSNLGTNEIVTLSDNKEQFNHIIEEIYKMQLFLENCENNHIPLPYCKDEIDEIRNSNNLVEFENQLKSFTELSEKIQMVAILKPKSIEIN